MRALPFDGYSWQLPHHESYFTASSTLALLRAAQQFDGQHEDDYGDAINAFVADRKILTQNLRAGKKSPWRDYQQILAELGLIVSTKASSRLVITPVGQAYLAGNLPFPAMMTTQLLRYQYPNGQKGQIARRDSVTAMIGAGIAIRPAATLLKVLVELNRSGITSISLSQVASFVLPNRTDQDWPLSVNEVKSGDPAIGPAVADTQIMRNIRAWVRLLSNTSLFSVSADFRLLGLSAYSAANIDDTDALASTLVASPLWVPDQSSPTFRANWFEFFGSLATQSSELEMTVAVALGDIAYQQVDDEPEPSATGPISLKAFSEIDTTVQFTEGLSGEALLESMRRGQKKLAFSKSEHDKIVNTVAQRYSALGYRLDHDPQSIDLLATSPDGFKKIVEVKTINPVNFGKQIRHALGQVLEYDFRLLRQGYSNTERVIVVNRSLSASDWRGDFCARHDTTLVSAGDWSGL